MNQLPEEIIQQEFDNHLLIRESHVHREYGAHVRTFRAGVAVGIESQSKASLALLEALEVCYKSLQTYGKHPLIDEQVTKAIASFKQQINTL